MSRVPRWLPDEPFPLYTYVPGQSPHPHADPAGHSHGARPALPACPDPGHWRECRAYLRGLDLFNHGYYWEAHEVWEGLWQAAGRKGLLADFFKGLIKLAAAGVKARAPHAAGVRSHARRARDLLASVTEQAGIRPEERFLGLELHALIAQADRLAERPVLALTAEEGNVSPVLPLVLLAA